MFSGVALPFTVAELITAGAELLKWVGPFILLSLAFVLAPKFFAIIKKAFQGKSNA